MPASGRHLTWNSPSRLVIEMPSPDRLTAECPRCGEVFETWALGTPDVDADPALGDPGWLFAASEVTCPHCGCTACSSGLAAERQAWRTDH